MFQRKKKKTFSTKRLSWNSMTPNLNKAHQPLLSYGQLGEFLFVESWARQNDNSIIIELLPVIYALINVNT